VRIALVTEGVSEFRALRLLYVQFHRRTPHTLLPPLKINVPPDAPPSIVARELKSRLIIAAERGANRALVLLDRERQQACPGAIAVDIERAVERTCRALPVQVALKDRTFENWLVADPSALEALPARFKMSKAAKSAIVPNKADRCDALALLKSSVVRNQYDKVLDSARICSRMDVEKAAMNSRSFRHLLHLLEDHDYRRQCKRP
jgi:hypothetical protein